MIVTSTDLERQGRPSRSRIRALPSASDVARTVPPPDRGSPLDRARDSRRPRLAAGYDVILHRPEATPEPSPADLPASERAVEVCCLGSFRCVVGGRQLDGWQSGRARALFQYLVTHRGHAIQRDTLLEALWPNPDAAAPATSLKVAAHALRRSLGQNDGEAAPLTILTDGATYRLDAPDLWLDVDEFERLYLLARSFELNGQNAEALRLYALAAALYDGDFLEEVSDEWPTFRREALKDTYLFIQAALATAALEREDYPEAVARCQLLLGKDRCREDTYRQLMICHSRLGQRTRVRSWYELCARALQVELDAAPDAETERVFRLAMDSRI